MTFPFGETITVIRRATRDRTGDPQGDDATHTITNVAIAWDSTSEDTDHRETVLTTATLFVPKAADILASDKVEFSDGSVWSVVGRPLWSGVHPLTGWDPGVKQVMVREVA